VHVEPAPGADELPDAVAGELGEPLAAKVRRTLEDFRILARRDTAGIERLADEVDETDPVLIPHLDGDVHDIDGLLAVHRHLFASGAEREQLLADAAV
jgi:hypothetical protein